MGVEDTRLSDLLDLWEESQEKGDTVNLEELCQDSPDLLPELRRKVTALKAFNTKLESINEATDTSAGVVHEDVRFESCFNELRMHAQGGLGVVCIGEDRRLNRPAAVKFLRQGLLNDQYSKEAFFLEAEITSRLEHPGIVPIYGIGETDNGRSFYVMRYVQGKTLDEAIEDLHRNPEAFNEHSAKFRNLLTHFIAVCKTIAYAHSRGIIHRDIKPSNVMLGRYGETLLIDWGLAVPVTIEDHFRIKDERTLMPTGSSKVNPNSSNEVGTPAYMSPEQMAGGATPHPSSDVYALGATLYKLLTGQVPIDLPSMPEMRRAIIRGEYVPPSSYNPRAPKPLEAICMKSMSSDPDKRYTTAMMLSEEIERYMSDESVHAYDEPSSRKFSRWSRRHRRAVQVGLLSGLILLLLVLTFSIGIAGAYRKEQDAREKLSSALESMADAEVKAISLTLENQLQQRLLAVEEMARHPDLVSAVNKAYSTKETDKRLWKNVNTWLSHHHIKSKDNPAYSKSILFVCLNDGKGTQIGRSPYLDSKTSKPVYSYGRSYGHRQYFRGGKPTPHLILALSSQSAEPLSLLLLKVLIA